MSYGSLRVRVRPIRFAFLVDPSESGAVYRAIELNSSLWGGSYNPIIPVYRRSPAKWESHRVSRAIQPQQIISGYLNGFDPDIVVPIGRCSGIQHEIGNRDIVKEEELLEGFSETETPKYGVGLVDLIRDFKEKEMKFLRSDNLHIAIAKMPRAHRMFLASVFGVVSPEVQEAIDAELSGVPGTVQLMPTIDNFIELWQPNRMFPRHISMWGIEHKPHRDTVLFVCDASSTLDVIDYWNLRAAGYYVVPIPIQTAGAEQTKRFAEEFISGNYHPYRGNPEMFHDTTVQRSRSLSEKSVEGFCKSLSVEKTKGKFTLRWWYPRLWDSWAREHAAEGISFPYSHDREQRLLDGESKVELRSLDPKIKLTSEYSGQPRFANEFSFRFYGAKEPMAEVIPEGSRELSSAIGRFGLHEWRFSKSGPVFLARNKEDLIFIDLPRAEAVMTGWLRERGWKVSLSGAGRIASQLVKQLGGSFGTSLLAHKGVIKLFRELEKEAGMSWSAVNEKLKRVIAEDNLYFDSEHFMARLIESNALRLGARVQCPVCIRYNWYELDAINHDLRCRFCLEEYGAPVGSPKKSIVWTYRAHGPFAASIAQGSFTVLLTLKFFQGHHDREITPLFSYQAEKGGKVLEADLTCLYRKSAWQETVTHVIHAECKSFNNFEKRDVERLKELGEEFPGAVLVFSTLKLSLEKSEINAIQRLVQGERRKRLRRSVYSPVVLLTGVELFSSQGGRQCWDGREGIYQQFNQRYFDFADLSALADATQQLYLGMPSWQSWAETKRKKKHRGRDDAA